MQRSCNVKNTINAVRCKGVHYVPPGCVLVTGFTPLYIHTTPEYRYFIQQKINCKNTKHWFILHPRPVIPTNADKKKFTKVPSYFILPGFVFFLLRINSFQGSYVNVGEKILLIGVVKKYLVQYCTFYYSQCHYKNYQRDNYQRRIY